MMTFRGSAGTHMIVSNNNANQNLFALINGYRSKVELKIRRLSVQNDGVMAHSSYSAVVRGTRVSAEDITGGIPVEKAAWDTEFDSDPAVRIVMDQFDVPSRVLVSDVGSVAWQQFTGRLRSAVEQQQGIDNNILPWVAVERPFTLKPGEALLVHARSWTDVANRPGNNMWMGLVMWEEYALETYQLKGRVTYGGQEVQGAKIVVLQSSDKDLSDLEIAEVVDSDVDGNWESAPIRKGVISSAFAQAKLGESLYTSEGRPYMEDQNEE